MKKLLIAVACLMAASSYADTLNYTGTATVGGAGGFFGNVSAPFSISLDTSQEILTVSMTFSGLSSNVSGMTLACCSSIAAGGAPTSAAIDLTNVPATMSGTYTASYNLALASSYDSAFLAANNNDVSMAYQSLLTGLNMPVGYIDIYTGVSRPAIAGHITPVPEPATYGLMALGLGLLAVRRRQSRAAD